MILEEQLSRMPAIFLTFMYVPKMCLSFQNKRKYMQATSVKLEELVN